TLAQSEPVDVSAETRERMYALGPAAAKVTIPEPVASPASLDARPGVASGAAPVHFEATGSAARPRQPVVAVAQKPEIPDYLRSKSHAGRVFGYAIVAIVLVCWAVVVFRNSPFGGDSSNENATDGKGNLAAADNEAPDNPGNESGDLMADSGKESGDTEDDVPAGNARPFQRNATDAAGANVAADGKGKSSKSGKKNRAAVDAAGPVPHPPEEQPDNIGPVGLCKYLSTEGVSLHYSLGDERWYVLPRGEMIGAGAMLAVPEPFQCQLEIANRQGLLTVCGHSVIGLLAASGTGDFGLELQRGRCVFRASSAADPDAVLSLRVAIAGEIWKVQLPTTAQCGVSIKPIEPTRLPETADKNAYDGGFYIAGGTAVITDPAGQVHEVQGGDWLELPLSGPGAANERPPHRELREIPKWMGPLTMSSIAQSKAAVFEKKFVRDEAIELSLPSIAEDPNPYISHMATDCLGLIEAYGPLVNALRSQHVEARRAAISELRLWLPRHADNQTLLKNELAKKFPPDDAETVFRLLQGYEQDDARDKLISTQLVEWMGHSELAIRELAFNQVYRLTGKTRDYQADGSPAKLQSSLRSWREHVKRDGGLIPAQKPTPNPL
ncbi:MAG: hypothetical protein JSS02_29025, partial [Planctomycetes bacterium]|nr:hypothetical protein [Planctomycetota bacterium]